jgi:hypothetical protein
MARRKLPECSFLIPLGRDANLSDGKEHDPDAWDWLESQLFELFGGATSTREPRTGFYRDPDTLQRVSDDSWWYAVAVQHGETRRLRSLLREACNVFSPEVHLSERRRLCRIRDEAR